MSQEPVKKTLPFFNVSSTSKVQLQIVPLNQLLQDRITDESKVPELEPIVRIDESVFAVKGDISVVGGLPKAGKTAISVFMLGTALKQLSINVDTLSIRSANCYEKPVIYIDTEQSRTFTNKLRKSVLKLIDENKSPKNFFVFNLRKYPRASDKLKIIMSLFQHFQDAHLWIIDGLADLVNNPNDVTESFQIVADFMSIADTMQTCIIFYLHENPGTLQKLRGNLGSEIERKCFGAINIRKDREKNFHWIEPRMLRGSIDFMKIYFRYDVDQQRMRSLDESEKAEAEKSVDKTAIKLTKLKELAEKATNKGKDCPLNYEALWPRIQEHHITVFGRIIRERSAQTKIKNMLENGILEKDNNNLYNLSKVNDGE